MKFSYQVHQPQYQGDYLLSFNFLEVYKQKIMVLTGHKSVNSLAVYQEVQRNLKLKKVLSLNYAFINQAKLQVLFRQITTDTEPILLPPQPAKPTPFPKKRNPLKLRLIEGNPI